MENKSKSKSIRILGIVPYDGMRIAMEQAAESYPDIQLDIYTGDLQDGVSIVEKATKDLYDCIISRGGTAELIRQICDTPVVEIPLMIYDILHAIKLVENYTNNFAIVGFPSITGPAHTLCSLLHYNLDILTIHSRDQAVCTLEKLKQEGCRMVVSDMITHTVALQLNMDAVLITSGMESILSALDQAVTISMRFQHLRHENSILRNVAQAENAYTIVFDETGTVNYTLPDPPPTDLILALRLKLSELPSSGSLKFYYNSNRLFYYITARRITVHSNRHALFRCIPGQIPLRSNKPGIRSYSRSECEYLLINSFYSIPGALGSLEKNIAAVSNTSRPILIAGESGVEKEHIAHMLYLRSSLSNKPFVVINCRLVNDKSWDFILNHYSSPLNAVGNTVYFQFLEELPEQRLTELLSSIQQTGLSRRIRLIFSCLCKNGLRLPDAGQKLLSSLDCISLKLLPLRERRDEISSLATMLLSGLNQEFGKQISGFDPQAIHFLRQYDWPDNYTQFKRVLQELLLLSDSSYIQANSVAEILARERAVNRPITFPPVSGQGTLEEIIKSAILTALAENNGNQSMAARQLNISRTTLWRHLNKKESSEKS
ncbi:MAG: PrpR N-terminal domain-containing protein [Eubacteriales bacterium]|nr:PrpR N-terminal domain-containing protein [Eubacteriales bacterium]